MAQIRDIMEKNVVTIEHDKTALDAARLISEKDVSFLVILDGDTPVGVVRAMGGVGRGLGPRRGRVSALEQHRGRISRGRLASANGARPPPMRAQAEAAAHDRAGRRAGPDRHRGPQRRVRVRAAARRAGPQRPRRLPPGVTPIPSPKAGQTAFIRPFAIFVALFRF